PGSADSFGLGGGGSLRRHGVDGTHVVLVSSLAKGFGVPMAVLAGSTAEIARFERESATRGHCSPPSFADLHAAAHAIEVNRAAGDLLRRRLAQLVRRFRHALRALGLRAADQSLFPVQSLLTPREADAGVLHRRLQQRGVRALLYKPACRPRAMVGFIITARHTPAGVDRAVDPVADAFHAGVAGGHR